MEYKVVVTADAEEDLNQYIRYLLMVKKSDQAAKNVLDDFQATIRSLKSVAGSLKLLFMNFRAGNHQEKARKNRKQKENEIREG